MVAWPLPEADQRQTPLSFGLFVTPDPANNPIDPPERFTGYHVAMDFEIRDDERTQDVPVSTICSGDVRFSGYAEGYGGLLVQNCRIDRQAVTILYGHLTLAPLPAEATRLQKGQQIGILAPTRSYESGETRKHLHLGIHRGKTLDLRGYVQTQEELQEYIDPLSVLKK